MALTMKTRKYYLAVAACVASGISATLAWLSSGGWPAGPVSRGVSSRGGVASLSQCGPAGGPASQPAISASPVAAAA